MTESQILFTKNNAEEYDYYVGTLDDAIRILQIAKINSKNIYILFNGVKLYSQFDNTDSCYKKITGKTKSMFEMEVKNYCKKFGIVKELER